MKTKFFLIALLILAIRHAANGQWVSKSIGNSAGVTHCFIESGGILLSGGNNNSVYASTNNGDSWTVSDSGIVPGSEILCFVKNSAGLFAGTDKIYFSYNNGVSWSIVNNGNEIFAFALLSDTIFAAAYKGGVLMSPDNGVTWIPRNSGLGNDSVYSIIAKGNLLFAGTFTNGIFASSNAGGNWSAVNTGLLLPTDITCLETDGVNLYAGTVAVWSGQPHGMFKSSNNGALWTQVTNGINTSGYVYSIKSIGTALLAASGSVFRSLDNGSTWSKFINGMDTACVGGVAGFYETSSYVFCGSEGCVGKSIYRIDKNQVVAGIETLEQNNSISIYPNPLTSSSILQLNTELIPIESGAEIIIYDMVGKEIMRKKLSGDRMEIEKGSLASGVYFVRISGEGRQWVQRMMVE